MAAAVAALNVAILLLLLLHAGAIHHRTLPPKVVLHTDRNSIVLIVVYVYANGNSTPLGSIRLCAASAFAYTIPLIAITGIRGAEGGRQSAAGKPPSSTRMCDTNRPLSEFSFP